MKLRTGMSEAALRETNKVISKSDDKKMDLNICKKETNYAN